MTQLSGTAVTFELGKNPMGRDLVNGTRRVRATIGAIFSAGSAGDTAIVTGIAAAVAAYTHDGSTYTLRGVSSVCAKPGLDSAGNNVYAGTLAVNGADITMTLGTAQTGAAAAVNATVYPIEFDVILDATIP